MKAVDFTTIRNLAYFVLITGLWMLIANALYISYTWVFWLVIFVPVTWEGFQYLWRYYRGFFPYTKLQKLHTLTDILACWFGGIPTYLIIRFLETHGR